MAQPNADAVFTGSIPQLYERALVPLLFEPYAVDLAQRVARRRPAHVLEVAAGTGVVTRRLASALPSESAITATDLNQPMLDEAARVGTARPVTWRQADAQNLPFPDASFDVVACQFGVMFFPDKARAFSEARRVLRPGGQLLFSVWDRLEDNEVSELVHQGVGSVFPEDPPRFLERVPFGYRDPAVIAQDLARGGFTRPPEWTTLTARSRADSAAAAAAAYCQGTPLRSEIEARDPARLAQATDAAARAIAARLGPGPVDAKMQALVVAVER